MTELAIPNEDPDLAVVTRRGPNHTDLTRWAERARQVHHIAVNLATTSFVSRQMAGRPDEVTGAILTGIELGIPPMAALRSIDIIDGTPAVRAHALRGIVQHHGHNVWVEESTETRAVVCGHRKGEPGKVQKSVWTADRAKKANLLGKKNWASHQQAMLVARATSELCRMIAADAIVGMPYSSEEIQDGIETAGEAGAAKEPRKIARRVSNPPGPAISVPLPERAQPEAVEKFNESIGDPLSIRTRTALNAAFTGAGIRDRADRLNFATRQLGHPVITSNDLTESEARDLISRLGNLPDEAAPNKDEEPGVPAPEETQEPSP